MGWRKHDLFRLRQAVGLLDLLDAYGLRDALRTSRGELVGACPLPGHAGDRSNRQAFRVSPAKGCWRCFTHCGGGDVVELAARLQGGSYAAAARVLADIEGRSTVRRPPRPPFAPQLSPSTSFQPYVKELVLRADHAFLRGKGIRPVTARQLDAGWWPLGGFLHGCIGVRLHDRDGWPLGYAGRRLDPDDIARWGKWKLPLGLPKHELLFNWHRALTLDGTDPLIVVEGPFDAMRIHQAGFPVVVALLGTQLSACQLALLRQAGHKRRILLLLDGDQAGQRASQHIAAALPPEIVLVAQLPAQHGPADLADEQLRAIIDQSSSRPARSFAGPGGSLPRTRPSPSQLHATDAPARTPTIPGTPDNSPNRCTSPHRSDCGCSPGMSSQASQNRTA